MTNSEEQTDKQLQEKIAKQNETKNTISKHIHEMKTIAESFTALLTGKEPFTEEDLDTVFELNDALEEQTQEITALLFDLRDKI